MEDYLPKDEYIYGTDFNIKTMGIPMGEVGSA